MRKFLLFILLLPTLTGCADGLWGHAHAAPTVRVQLNEPPGVNVAGYYQALEQGFYEQQGLRVSLLPGGKRGTAMLDPAQILLSGQSEFAVLSFAQYRSIAADKRQPLVVMGLFQISPRVLLSLQEQGIERLPEIAGTRVAIPSPEWESIVHCLLKNVNLSPEDITEIPLETPDIHNLYFRQVDIWPGYITEDGAQALLDGYRVNMVFASEYGLNTYEGLFVTTQAYAEAHPEVVEALVSATLQGWQYTLKNIEESAELLASLDPQHPRLYYQLGLEYIRPLADTGEVPLGWIDDTRWDSLLNLSPEGTDAPGYDMRFVEQAHLQE